MRRGIVFGLLIVGVLWGGITAYTRQSKVPAEVIRTSVIRTEDLLDKAWRLPAAETYGHDLQWQSNGSVCGPASLANVFRSLGEAVDTEAEVLVGTTSCWFHVCPVGLTLDQLADLAQAHTARKVTVLRDLTPDAFREILRDTNNPERRYVINFSRQPIFGAGVGHISPIGGYLEDGDLVFVLDVNQDYRPWLIEPARLYSAMDTFDGDKKRGLLRIE
jgi:Phytochelatin synthase